MTIDEALARPKIERGEAEILLAHVLRRPKEYVLAHPEAPVPKTHTGEFLRLCARRAKHEPLAYLLGEKWFYGRPFFVDKNVLIPRPETETLVQAILDTGPYEDEKPLIIDVGTGSGAVGLTLAAELHHAQAVLLDVSPKALAVARHNARRLKLSRRVRLLRIDILKKTASQKLTPDAFLRRRKYGRLIIAANLPYLPTATYRKSQPEVRVHEPRLALVSGRDGLDHYRALMDRLREAGLAPDLLLLEADPPQFAALKKVVRGALPGHRLEIKKDLAGNARVLLAIAE
jgi:release factor glutamine methyltransferase